MEHGHDRLGQLLVEVVGEDVDEVSDARPRRLRPRLGQPEPCGPADERGAMRRGQTALLREAEQPLEQPAGRPAASARRC